MGMWLYLLAMMFANIFFAIGGNWFGAIVFDILCQIGVTLTIGFGLRGDCP